MSNKDSFTIRGVEDIEFTVETLYHYNKILRVYVCTSCDVWGNLHYEQLIEFLEHFFKCCGTFTEMSNGKREMDICEVDDCCTYYRIKQSGNVFCVN